MPARLRRLKRLLDIDGDSVVFPNTEITTGVITSGGTLTYEDSGTDIQTQINSVVASVAAIDVHAHVQEDVCYVDSKRVDSYTPDGSESLPYKSLKTALETKLTNSATAFISFRVASGNYDGTVAIDKDSANQSFEIIGAGRNLTFVRGASSFSSSTPTVLYFRDFLDIKVQSLTLCNGLYGFYPRSCRNIQMYDLEFKHLGSAGEEKYHDMSETQANQQSYWAGNSTSDGGTCRIRSCTDVRMDNCRSSYCLRGYRIQDCSGGALTNLRGYKLLESFIYLASGSYDGDPNYGCHNFYISGCSADTIFHTAYQCIGGRSNTFQGCSAVNCASGPFVLHAAADVRIIGCTADKCLTKTWIGIGADGDNFGQVYKVGKNNVVDTGGYELTCLNCTFTQCGVGRSVSGNSTTFYIQNNAGHTSSRFIIDGNHSDATVGLFNPDGITEVLAQYPASVAGVSQATFDALEVEVDANTSAVESLQSDVTDNQNAAAQNTIDINDKQDTLTWSTVGDDDEANPVTSKNIKAYCDANAGGSGASLGANTFTDSQTIEKNGNCSIKVRHTGYADGISLVDNYGDAGIIYHGKSALKFNSGRIMCEGGCILFQPPRVSTLDGTNASHGCICVDDSNGATNLKLKFHDGSSWKNVDLS